MLKEDFRKTDLFGIGCIALGSITVIFSSAGKEAVLLPEDVVKALMTIPTLIYSLVSLGLGIGLGVLSEGRWGEEHPVVDVGISAVAGGFTVLATKA